MIHVMFLTCQLAFNPALADHVITYCRYGGLIEVAEPRREDAAWKEASENCMREAQEYSIKLEETWACMTVDAAATDGVKFHRGQLVEETNG